MCVRTRGRSVCVRVCVRRCVGSREPDSRVSVFSRDTDNTLRPRLRSWHGGGGGRLVTLRMKCATQIKHVHNVARCDVTSENDKKKQRNEIEAD